MAGPNDPSAEMPSWPCSAETAGPLEPSRSRPPPVVAVVAVVVVAVVEEVSCADAVCCTSGARIAEAAIATPTLREAGRLRCAVAARVRRSCERFNERCHVAAQARSRPPSSCGSARIAHPSSVSAVVRISGPELLVLLTAYEVS